MATHASILAWRIPRTEEPGGLQSMGSQRVGHDWSNLAAAERQTHMFLQIKFYWNDLFPTTLLFCSLRAGENNCPQSAYHFACCLWPPLLCDITVEWLSWRRSGSQNLKHLWVKFADSYRRLRQNSEKWRLLPWSCVMHLWPCLRKAGQQNQQQRLCSRRAVRPLWWTWAFQPLLHSLCVWRVHWLSLCHGPSPKGQRVEGSSPLSFICKCE